MTATIAGKRSKDVFGLAVALAIPLVAGLTGSILTSQSVSEWYPTLTKPSFTPPNWVFGPVWTALYVLMGIALFLVWKNTRNIPRKTSAITKMTLRGYNIRKLALAAFTIQLALNILWSALFFGLRSPSLAFAEIVFLWAAIVANIAIFTKISRLATLLLLPYIIWTSIALTLNLQIWILNR